MRTGIILILVLFLTGQTAIAQGGKEADLKAAFIYNFIRYTDWDSTNLQSDFRIGILGTSAVTSPLMEIAKTGYIKNRRIVIQRFYRPEDITYCNVLFIAQRIPFSLPSILERVPRGMLTISEENGFARQGTDLNFVLINNKLKFEANLEAILSSGLRVSSKLLKLAIIVQ